MEVTIYYAVTGTHAGEYIASCPRDKCSYLGEFSYVLGLVLDLVVLTSDSANGASLHPSWTIR